MEKGVISLGGASVVLVEDADACAALLPLTYTCALADLRVGVFTLAEKWALWTGSYPRLCCVMPTLERTYAQGPLVVGDVLCVDAALYPDADLCASFAGLCVGEGLYASGQLLGVRLRSSQWSEGAPLRTYEPLIDKRHEYTRPFVRIATLMCLLDKNAVAIEEDCMLAGCMPVAFTQVFYAQGSHPLYIDASARVGAAFFDTEQGPIYVGPRAVVEPSVVLQGPCALGEGSRAVAGARLRAGTSIGPYCKVGGELSATVLHSYSNKAHDGFLGHSVVGRWCNLGAGTSCSNLKNNYGEVSLWDYRHHDYRNTGRQFCGLFMGDYAKAAINQSFNTATVVGPFSNVFGAGFPPRMLPAFSWGGAGGLRTYRLAEALAAAGRMMKRRDQQLTDLQLAHFAAIFEQTADARGWEREGGNHG